jgi:hypothetical protein
MDVYGSSISVSFLSYDNIYIYIYIYIHLYIVSGWDYADIGVKQSGAV